MDLTVKPIVNGLFHATVRIEKFEGTAIGYTKDEATTKALSWIQREIEFTYRETLAKQDSGLSENPNYNLDFLKSKVWRGLDDEVRELASQVAVIALKAGLKMAISASIGGSMGGLFGVL